ncbi:MFS transporter [Hyphomonas sp.]|uniref:MFS transporter n=1 Tax=Hyphomonas sp. TaxID=87 RepID=UPI0025BCACB5|nr:MFS transporter [Hyphomonas sp.]
MTTYPPLSVREKVAYGLGDMASNLYNGFFGIFLLYYYTDVWGIHPGHAALMFLVTRWVDAITDPAMGLIADRTNTKWGKYRPYILWTIIPYALLGYLLFLGPDLGDTGKVIYAYVTYSLVMLAYTAINVPYSALLAVIHPDSAERTKATQYRFVLASLGSIVVGAGTKPLVDALGGGDELTGFRLTIVLFAILSVILFLITFAFTRERIAPAKQENAKIKDDLGVLIRNISWVVLAVASVLIVIGLIGRLSSVAFYVKYVLELSDEKRLWWMDSTSLIITAGFVGQLVGALVTPLLVRKSDKKTLLIAACCLAATALLFNYFLPASFVVALVAHVIVMLGFGIMITLLFAMYTDCSEYGEWVSGKNSAGLTVSASMFALKFGSAIGVAIPSAILAVFGFKSPIDGAAQVQTGEAVGGIVMMFNIVPGAFFLAAAAFIWFYRIDRKLLSLIETEMRARREGAALFDPAAA